MERTCFTCSNRPVCFAHRDIMNTTKEMHVNIDGETAPGKWLDVFTAMGRCCLKYNPVKKAE